MFYWHNSVSTVLCDWNTFIVSFPDRILIFAFVFLGRFLGIVHLLGILFVLIETVLRRKPIFCSGYILKFRSNIMVKGGKSYSSAFFVAAARMWTKIYNVDSWKSCVLFDEPFLLPLYNWLLWNIIFFIIGVSRLLFVLFRNGKSLLSLLLSERFRYFLVWSSPLVLPLILIYVGAELIPLMLRIPSLSGFATNVNHASHTTSANGNKLLPLRLVIHVSLFLWWDCAAFQREGDVVKSLQIDLVVAFCCGACFEFALTII